MTTEMRKSGIDVVGDMPWGTHVCLFYETKEDLLDTLVSYCKAGLESQEFCLWVVAEPVSVDEARRALKKVVPDLDRYLADQSIDIVSADDWYLQGGTFDLKKVMSGWHEKLALALARGYAGVRVTGDTAWLEKKDWKDFCEYEEALNESIANQCLAVLCTYPLAACGAAEILDVVRTHQFAIAKRRESWEIIETPGLKQAKAEIKRMNEELEQRVVERTSQLTAVNEELTKEILERRRAEEALRESERRYRHIFQAVGVSIWQEDFSQVKAAIDNLKGQGIQDFRQYFAEDPEFVRQAIAMVRIVDVNDATLKLFSAESKDELLVSLHKVFVPGTQEVFVGEMVAFAEGRTSFAAETVLQTLKGERLIALFTITFPPEPAKLDSVLVSIVDITERKRAEYLTGQVFESSPDGMSIVGRDYRLQRVNAIYERKGGIPTERIVGMHAADFMGTDVFEQSIKPNLDRCFAGEEVSYGEWFAGALGRRYVSVSYSPLRPDSERVEAALVISRDLTEHMLASEALHQAQAELAHVSRVTTLGELAASIAHEINQPLAAIVADANASLNWLAAANPETDVVREALVAIVQDGHRAADVIERIRQLARKTEPQKVRVDINDVIRDVIRLVRTEVRGHAASLRVDLAPALPSVLGDRVQLQQVLLNLVMNGIEAMASVDDRPRTLVIHSRLHEGDQVLAAVEDAGVGIDPGKMDQLFTAFFTTKPGGMGMGLSISRSIIDAHGGRLWATRNPNQGATFHFTLPGIR